jgi:hypothetical protein
VATGTCAAFVVASPPELGREMRAGGSAAGQFDAAKGVRADDRNSATGTCASSGEARRRPVTARGRGGPRGLPYSTSATPAPRRVSGAHPQRDPLVPPTPTSGARRPPLRVGASDVRATGIVVGKPRSAPQVAVVAATALDEGEQRGVAFRDPFLALSH